jgi:hypothetical protein
MHAGMWYGIFVHRFLEYAVTKGHSEAIKYIKSKGTASKGSARNAMNTCLKIDLDQIPMGEAEVGLAHDLINDVSRRVYGRHDKATRYESYGKADLIFSDDLVHIADYKSGWLDGDPTNHPQLLGLACAVRKEKKVETLKASIVGVASSGEMHWNTVVYPPAHLDAFETRMKRVHLRVLSDRDAFNAGVNPEFVPGAHCNRCGCQPVCPAIPNKPLRI